MVTEEERQAIGDKAQLDLLPIAYWVSAGFWGLYALFVFAYFAFIAFVLLAIPDESSGPPPPEVVWGFVGFGLFFLIVMGSMVVLKVLVGFWIRERKHRVGTMLVAALTCLEIPYGTLIGVWTFIAFARPSVKALYERRGTVTTFGQVVHPPPAAPPQAPANAFGPPST